MNENIIYKTCDKLVKAGATTTAMTFSGAMISAALKNKKALKAFGYVTNASAFTTFALTVVEFGVVVTEIVIDEYKSSHNTKNVTN